MVGLPLKTTFSWIARTMRLISTLLMAWPFVFMCCGKLSLFWNLTQQSRSSCSKRPVVVLFLDIGVSVAIIIYYLMWGVATFDLSSNRHKHFREWEREGLLYIKDWAGSFEARAPWCQHKQVAERELGQRFTSEKMFLQLCFVFREIFYVTCDIFIYLLLLLLLLLLFLCKNINLWEDIDKVMDIFPEFDRTNQVSYDVLVQIFYENILPHFKMCSLQSQT